VAIAAAAFALGFTVRPTSSGGQSAAARFTLPQAPSSGASNGGGSSSGSANGGGAANGGSGSVDPTQIANRVDDAVLNITTTMAGGGEAAGTGMVLTADGEVLTNFHVIDGATSIEAEVGVTGKTYHATVVGYDQSEDIALLKLTRASGLATVHLGDSAAVSVDDAIVALGNALGQGGAPAVASGTVTALDQTVTAGDASGSETLDGMIQISAAIQSGDSGGPVVDTAGDVVGITTAADVGSSGFGGGFGSSATGTTGYAIPIDHAEAIVQQIRSGSTAGGVHLGARGYLGVRATDGESGAGVVGVESGSAADAGIQAGDVITAVGGTRITGADQLGTVLGAYAAGDRVSISWTDGSGTGHRATVTLTSLG
jgi:S1-C subfamily serine protease